jgi:hypothetical protein
MHRVFASMLVVGVLIYGADYAWSRYHHDQSSENEQSAGPDSQPADSRNSQSSGTVLGPLAEFINYIKPSTAQARQRVTVASDHVAESPVGTGAAVLHKTFNLANMIDVPLQVPAHAASPHLVGTFRSYTSHAGEQNSDMTANIDFLLLNESQHADFLSGHPSEAVFSAEDTHDQEVNFLMPATFSQPAKYFLVFRNGSQGKKVVQADFHVEF